MLFSANRQAKIAKKEVDGIIMSEYCRNKWMLVANPASRAKDDPRMMPAQRDRVHCAKQGGGRQLSYVAMGKNILMYQTVNKRSRCKRMGYK